MFRGLLCLAMIIATLLVPGLYGDSAQTSSAARVQSVDCADMRVGQAGAALPAGAGGGISIADLAAMLGIGVLTLVFFVPAALLFEMLKCRNRPGEGHDVTCEGP